MQKPLHQSILEEFGKKVLKDYELPARKDGDFSAKVFTEINQIRLGEIPDTRHWVWKV